MSGNCLCDRHKTILAADSFRSALFPAVCLILLQSSTPVADLSDEEIMDRLVKQELPHHKLEQLLGDPVRAVQLRRLLLARDLAGPLSPVGSGADAAVNGLPSASFNISEFYGSIEGSNCENVIG